MSDDLRSDDPARRLHERLGLVLTISLPPAGKALGDSLMLGHGGPVQVGVRAGPRDGTASTRSASQPGGSVGLAPGKVMLDNVGGRQALLHLLSNAAKLTAEGVVGLELRLEPDHITFVVRDTGIGIAPAHLERIFEPFEQVDEGTTRRFGGTGLGLAISARLAIMMGGPLTADRVLGQGSTFTRRLPRAEPKPAYVSGSPLLDIASAMP